MAVAEIIAICVVVVNVLWGCVYLVSKGFANETVTVMTALAGAITAGAVAWAKFKGRGDSGGQ